MELRESDPQALLSSARRGGKPQFQWMLFSLAHSTSPCDKLRWIPSSSLIFLLDGGAFYLQTYVCGGKRRCLFPRFHSESISHLPLSPISHSLSFLTFYSSAFLLNISKVQTVERLQQKLAD